MVVWEKLRGGWGARWGGFSHRAPLCEGRCGCHRHISCCTTKRTQHELDPESSVWFWFSWGPSEWDSQHDRLWAQVLLHVPASGGEISLLVQFVSSWLQRAARSVWTVCTDTNIWAALGRLRSQPQADDELNPWTQTCCFYGSSFNKVCSRDVDDTMKQEVS